MFKFSQYEYKPKEGGEKSVVEEKPKSPRVLFSICEIRPYLFIAGYGALSEQKFKELGITHAIDFTNLPKPVVIKDVEYLYLKGDDRETYPVKKHFQETADFIKNAKDKGGKTVVYCAAGVSRAATICMIYLLIHDGLSLKEAYEEVARARPLIAPNTGFWRQMIDFESAKTGGKPTVELLKGMSRPVPSVYLYKSKIIGSP